MRTSNFLIKGMALCSNLCTGWSTRLKVIAIICGLALLCNYIMFIHYKSASPFKQLATSVNSGSKTVFRSRYVPAFPPRFNSSFLNIITRAPPGVESNATKVASAVDKLTEEPTPSNNLTTQGKQPSAGDVKGDTVASPGMPDCPHKPEGLVGAIKTYLDPIEMSAVENSYPDVKLGGSYRPPDCRPTQKLAVVIPCRNRDAHLAILLNNLVGLLIKQKIEFTIFTIDQEEPTTFNRGMLFNVGFMEALKRGAYTCFIFHDVDMIPANDNCLYKCSEHPRHFLTGVNKWKYGLPYYGYYGGVVGFSKEQFEKINGDSNLYFGWGGEDDDLLARVQGKGYKLVRYPKPIGLYDTVSHKRDHGNGDNPKRFELLGKRASRQDVEGLSTTKYKVTEVVERKLYTKIKVFINMTEVLETAPANLKPGFREQFKQAKIFDQAYKTKQQQLKSNSSITDNPQKTRRRFL